MNKGYISYRLIHDGSATPILKTAESFHFPDIKDSNRQNSDTVLLSSGFSTLFKDSPYLLSPALQLNGDLSGLDHEQLRTFADAELKRKHQAIFNSYTIEPENLLCVLSNNRDQLETFINTYGGLLTIEALLLTDSHPDFGSVTEITISHNSKAYTINYALRSPIDYTKCNYCGECAKLCPESCISETLYFDFKKCTFCRDCEKVCPTGAIDIYAIERRTLTVPSIVILGETSIELPENKENIYTEETLDNYLSSLYPYQVEEVIACNQSICQYSTRTKSGCSLCLDGCTFGAISASDGITINSQKCVECGYCAGICPTGAIQYLRFDDESFFHFFRSFQLPKDSLIVLGEEIQLHRLWWNNRENSYPGTIFLEFPNTKALSSLHLLFLLAHGASRILILGEEKKSHPALLKTVEEVNDLLNRLLDGEPRVALCPAESFNAVGDTFAKEGFIQTRYTNLNYINRRDKLASVIKFFVELSAKTISISSESSSLLSSVICNENACTQCLACLNECNIQALSADPSALSLFWNGSLCTGCLACVSVCPESALATGNSIDLTPDYFSPVVFSQAEPMRCKECGKVFGTKKSFDRVMQILAKQNLDHDGHFEYCENCRVIKLLENE